MRWRLYSQRRVAVIVAAVAALIVLFVANRRYIYPESLRMLPALTAAHIADPRYSGATFQLEGLVDSVRTSRQEIIFIRMHQTEEDVFIHVPVFPSLGRLRVKPKCGETLRVTGNLGMYSGRPQLRPLSVEHVKLVSVEHVKLAGRLADSVSVADAVARVGETLLVGPVIAVKAEYFKSRAGLKHLRLKLADASGGATVAGIMFEGNRADCEVGLLWSDGPFLVRARVELFRGAPSLNVQRVLAVSE